VKAGNKSLSELPEQHRIEKGGSGGTPRGNPRGIRPRFQLEIKDLGFGSHVDQVRAAVQGHVGKEVLLVNLTSLGTGDSNTDRHFVLHQVWQVVAGAVACRGFCVEITPLVGPDHPVIDEKQIDRVPLLVGNLGKLETARRRLDVVTAQNEQKITHPFLLSR
jgi:hypothetical protein